jgi:hypothetical protein
MIPYPVVACSKTLLCPAAFLKIVDTARYQGNIEDVAGRKQRLRLDSCAVVTHNDLAGENA